MEAYNILTETFPNKTPSYLRGRGRDDGHIGHIETVKNHLKLVTEARSPGYCLSCKHAKEQLLLVSQDRLTAFEIASILSLRPLNADTAVALIPSLVNFADRDPVSGPKLDTVITSCL